MPLADYETRLDPRQENAFLEWKSRYAPMDSGMDYDLRGAFLAGLRPDATGHWPDTFKKPNHPTFSVESRYASSSPERAGSWADDGTYLPALPPVGRGMARQPSLSELQWFADNRKTGGMMTPDGRVILNPHSGLNQDQRTAVLYNEAARLRMLDNRASFALTPQQQAAFADYGSPQDQRDTIAARILSGDPSAGAATREQQSWVRRNLGVGQYGPANADPLFMLQLRRRLRGGEPAPANVRQTMGVLERMMNPSGRLDSAIANRSMLTEPGAGAIPNVYRDALQREGALPDYSPGAYRDWQTRI